MNGGSRIFFAAGALALAARVVAGCATTDDSNVGEATPAEEKDASTSVPPDPTPDADVPLPDADKGDAADAGPLRNTCSEDGWCYTPLPQPDSYDSSAMKPTLDGHTFALRAVWVAPDHHVWSVSKAGHVLHWDGSKWRVEALVGKELRAIWGSSPTDIWVAGEQGTVLHGTYAGGVLTLVPVKIGTTQLLTRIIGTSPTDVWVIADGPGNSGKLNRIWHLTPANPAFVAVTVPSTYTDSSANLRIHSIWYSGNDLWAAGYETACIPPKPCKFNNELVAIKRTEVPDGGSTWQNIPFRKGLSSPIWGATTTTDGVHLFAIGDDIYNTSLVARLTDDPSKLDAFSDAGITHEGAYAWTQELATSVGSPSAIWASTQNDVWVVGQSGFIRHFDGTAWQLVRTSLTNVTPMLQDLYDIKVDTNAAGEQEMWVVGDDVVIHRKVKP